MWTNDDESSTEKHQEPNSSQRYLGPLAEYKNTVARKFPALERQVLKNCTISSVDAVFLGHFLEHYDSNVVALEIGAFVGVSAFCLATHPTVSKVISVDPNPVIADELTANTDRWTGKIDFGELREVRPFDIARATLAEFPEQREKIEFREGVVGSTRIGAKLEPDEAVEKIEVPALETSGDHSVLAMVDGLHTKEGVREDLAAIFGRNPHAVALLDDCRRGWGPFVQAGVVDFMAQANESYHFRLVADLIPALASSNFGILYPDASGERIEDVLENILREADHESPEPRTKNSNLQEKNSDLRSKTSKLQEENVNLQRKNSDLRSKNFNLREKDSDLREKNSDLRSKASSLRNKNSQLNQRNRNLNSLNSNLKQRNDRLVAHYASRRYKIVDALINTTLRIPAVRKLLERTAPPENGGGR